MRNRPILSSLIIAVLAGVLLQMYNIIEFAELIDGLITDHRPTVRLIDFAFRMTMGAALVLVVVPFIHGYLRRPRWRGDYLPAMRLSMGTDPTLTVAAAIVSLLAFVGVLATSALGAGVFNFDPGVLVEDESWLILLAALVPGIWEELAFRGFVLTNLQLRFSPAVAVVISSIVFGLFHFSNLFGNWDDIGSVVAGAVAATTLGLGWGYLAIKTNSIVPVILSHYLVDVLLYNEFLIDPMAGDDSTSVVYLAVALVYPLLTILFTKSLYRTGDMKRINAGT
jgi:membrane protease YdiL (CAAX protease family)